LTTSFPLLDEPLVIEFANTDYLDASGPVDYLGTPELVRGWMDEVCPDRIAAPLGVSANDVRSLLELRRCVRATLDKPLEVKTKALRVINDAARLRPTARLLVVTESGKPTLAIPPNINDVEHLMTTLADDTISLLTGTVAEVVRTCDRPGCHMRYLQQHHRRRYCNPRCASADRQARYNRRRTSAE